MAKKEAVIYPAIPSSISQINKAYTQAYITGELKAGRLSRKQVRELKECYLAAKKESAGRYFFPYRKNFVRICMPNLYKPTSKDNMEDFFNRILEDE